MFYFVEGDHWSPFFSSSITTPQSTLSTAPLYGSLTMPLLEERWHAVSEWWLLFDILFSVSLSPLLSRLCRQLPSMGALLIPLLEERWHAVSEWWLLFDVPFFPAGDQWSPLHSFFVGAVIGRPFLVSKTSYGTAPLTFLLLPSFPFPHSNTLRQADMACLIY